MLLLLDLGTTYMRFGWATPKLSLPFSIVSTPSTSDAIVETICTQVQEVKMRVTGLAIGCPGLIDQVGHIHAALYVALNGINLQEVLQQRLQCPVVVINDAKAQALGCLDSAESLSYIVIGTAVGGAHIENGQLVLGQNGFAGEIGHIRVGDSTDQCPCGQYGCLNTTTSGWYLTNTLGHEWWTLPRTTKTTQALDRAGRSIGAAALLLAVLLNPARIIIAGHICDHPEFRQGVLVSWNKRTLMSASLQFYVDTWQFAWTGLSRIAKIKNLERGIVNE